MRFETEPTAAAVDWIRDARVRAGAVEAEWDLWSSPV